MVRRPEFCRQRCRLKLALRSKPWVVYAKTPLAGPAAVLDYLSRYTHRTAIGNERLLDIHGETVRFRTRVNRKHPANDGANPSTDGQGDRGGSRFTTSPGTEFIHRLMQHVYPTGFKRIRSLRHCAVCSRQQPKPIA